MTFLSIFLLLSTCFAIIITYASGIIHVEKEYQGGSSRINEKYILLLILYNTFHLKQYLFNDQKG